MRDLLILTPDFPPETGGIQTLMHRIASSLERSRPRVVTLGSGGESAFDQAQRSRSSVSGRRAQHGTCASSH